MAVKSTESKIAQLVFATFAEDSENLDHVYIMAESIREFADDMKDAPIWLYVPDYAELSMEKVASRFAPLNVTVRISTAPEDSRLFYYSGKTYAAGQAEHDAENVASILVWMDEDTIILRKPQEFLLPDSVVLGYRPVMHNRSGSLKSEKPNPFWSRIYDLLAVAEDNLFPMVTPADQQTIRAYFNAGLLVVRPERGILTKWSHDFAVLYRDSVLARTCRDDITARIFLHQTALVGSVLNTIRRNEMVELSAAYNYPLFFERMFGATSEFGSIEDVVSLRYDTYFRKPDPDWQQRLRGPEPQRSWLIARLGEISAVK
ncbi:MAG: hypothetical protein ABIE70_13000 [bacterium]